MHMVAETMNDYRHIRLPAEGYHTRPISPSTTRAWHEASVAFLEEALIGDSETRDARIGRGAMPTVVVTHHAPSPQSLGKPPPFDAEAAAYASDLSDLLGWAGLWVHGHIHKRLDYGVANNRGGLTRVLANPRGYAGIESVDECDAGWSWSWTSEGMPWAHRRPDKRRSLPPKRPHHASRVLGAHGGRAAPRHGPAIAPPRDRHATISHRNPYPEREIPGPAAQPNARLSTSAPWLIPPGRKPGDAPILSRGQGVVGKRVFGHNPKAFPKPADMTIHKSVSSTLYWLIGATPITSAIIYFSFRLFGIDIGVRGVLLMVVLLLAIKIALWFVLRIFYVRTRDDDHYG